VRKTILLVIGVWAMAAGPAWSEITWNFDDGLQGWTIVNSGTINIGKWVAPGENVLLATYTGDPANPVPVYSQAGGCNVYLPGDGNGRTTAILDVSSLLVGGKTQSFTLQADVWIPNLRPFNFRYNYPGMLNQYSGLIALNANTGYGITLGGNLVQGSQQYRDYTSEDWVRHEASWCMEDKNLSDPFDTMWNCWIKLKIDWNYTTPGNVIASAFIPFDNYVGNANEWITVWSGEIEPSTWQPRPFELTRIAIGSYLKGDGPWSKSQFDNVVFDSPDLIVALALDILPDSCPNDFTVNLQGKGRLPMAILGSETFDVSTIDVDTISIGGVAFPVKAPSIMDVSARAGEGECACQMGVDGYADLVLHFSRRDVIQALGLDAMEPGTVVPVSVEGYLTNGKPFKATDCVTLVERE
jgi:hypothetical protein